MWCYIRAFCPNMASRKEWLWYMVLTISTLQNTISLRGQNITLVYNITPRAKQWMELWSQSYTADGAIKVLLSHLPIAYWWKEFYGNKAKITISHEDRLSRWMYCRVAVHDRSRCRRWLRVDMYSYRLTDQSALSYVWNCYHRHAQNNHWSSA